MEARYGRAQRIWVMDRGMVSDETVAWLQDGQRRYLVGANKNDLKKLAPQLAEARDWQQVRDGVEVKLCTGPEARRRSCWSARPSGRTRSTPCMSASASASRPVWKPRGPPCTRQEADRSRRHRTADRPAARPQHARRRALCHPPGRRAQRCRQAVASTGRYGPTGTTGRGTARAATCCAPTSPTGRHRPLWQIYIQLIEAEAAFRIHKSDLSIRPIWHQRARSRARPHPRLLSGLRAVEDARAVAKPRGARQQPADPAPRTRRHPQRRHRPAHRRNASARPAVALRRTTRQGPGRPPRSPRPAPSRKAANQHRLNTNVVQTRTPKSLIILACARQTAEVGLAYSSSRRAEA